MSHRTINRKRKANRKSAAQDIKINFPADKVTTIHWDGKMLADMTDTTKKDRLVIVASGANCEQILAVPKLNNATGAAQANAIFEEAKDWNINSSLEAVSFDTTAVNTGKQIKIIY